ncbi:unnamed protein product [Clonostachys rosea]|uniref:Ubiquitin-like domain-containing protein n=1 Tax=Bionectria ochroleuca TaxID=29856 RepID=A0ABY6U2E1_BIOOC|nr:unnamed protein product [Clonostachys rosea]
MSRYGWSNIHGRISPFGRQDDDAPSVTDEDFAYITSQDLEDFRTKSSETSKRDDPPSNSQEPEDDVLLLKNKGVTYPMHFPAYSIGDGKLLVADLKARLGILMDLTDKQVQDTRLLYKGKQLDNSDSPVREYGVKNQSEILSVVPQPEARAVYKGPGSRMETVPTRKGTEGVQIPDGGYSSQRLNITGESHERAFDRDRWAQVNDARYDSDNESTTSVASSVFSNASSSSASSVGSVEHRKEVSEQLVDMLFGDDQVRAPYHVAVRELGDRAFLKVHKRILSRYLDGLKDSTKDHNLLLVTRTLSSRSQKSRVSQLIVRRVYGTAPATSSTARTAREKRLNERLKLASQTNRAPEAQDETSDEEEDEAEDWLRYLNLVVDFFLESTQFQEFKSNLQFVTNLPQTMQEAISHDDPLFITIFLDTRFREAASGDYVWITELKEIGYSNTEIAQLLHEKAHDSPWIYFEPEEIPFSETLSENHLLDCAHNLKSGSPRKNRTAFSSSSLDQDRQVRQAVEALCGLGGISPISRNKREWSGTVQFDKGTSMATINYSHQETDDQGRFFTDDPLSRFIQIAERFETAARMVQDANFCCDSFTVVRFADKLKFSVRPEVQLSRIEFSLARNLLENMKSEAEGNRRGQHAAGEIAIIIISKVVDTPPPITYNNPYHLYSLALQVLCVGFISYVQAHIGPVQPFFIDTPLKRILLKGFQIYHYPETHIVAELVNLTCLGRMCQGPVLAFRLAFRESLLADEEGSDSRDFNIKHDIRATPIDILDTWGPGELLFQLEKSSSPSAIKIGGGYISPPSADAPYSKYHWDRCLRLPQNPAPIALNEPLTIGGLVNVNAGCKNEEQACWSASLGKFEELGTHRSFFEAKEYQFGFQGGPDNFSLTGNKVWSKRRGRTIKSRNLEQEDYLLVPFLSFYWGVRVSYCTGVAQRVALRQLVADLLPAFSKTYTSMEAKKSWQELISQHHIIETFQTSNSAQELSDWLSDLPDKLYKFVLGLIRQILGTLADTGLSPDGTQFLVGWPYNGVVNRCFHIPLSSYNTWAPILADSDDCATFAYMTNTCLESGSMTCRGPNPNWDNRLYMLETAVLCPASTGAWSLRHERTYFFHKLDNNLYWVKAQREATQTGVPASLVRLVSARSIPHDIRQRLIFKEERKKEKRLREKDLASVPAEVVCVRSLGPFSTQGLDKALS